MLAALLPKRRKLGSTLPKNCCLFQNTVINFWILTQLILLKLSKHVYFLVRQNTVWLKNAMKLLLTFVLRTRNHQLAESFLVAWSQGVIKIRQGLIGFGLCLRVGNAFTLSLPVCMPRPKQPPNNKEDWGQMPSCFWAHAQNKESMLWTTRIYSHKQIVQTHGVLIIELSIQKTQLVTFDELNALLSNTISGWANLCAPLLHLFFSTTELVNCLAFAQK